MSYIKSYKIFESIKNIKYTIETVDVYSGQYNMELGAYIDGEIVGLIEYVLYDDEITISDITVVPKYRRMGIGSRLIGKMKEEHPEYKYRPSMKTDLGSKFIHKKVDDINNIYMI